MELLEKEIAELEQEVKSIEDYFSSGSYNDLGEKERRYEEVKILLEEKSNRYLDLLEKEECSADAARYIKVIRNRAEALTQLTEELFRYSVFTTISDGTSTEPVILNRLLEESISAYYAILKQNHISPRISLPDTKVSRMLNRSACSRIFGNLISNAIKYSDGDLEITLRESGEIIFSNHASHLNEVQAGRLFDRFYTVETASADSTGLGLSIARALTEQMGGKIDAAYKNGILYVRVIFDFA